jgi:hypothetical protein
MNIVEFIKSLFAKRNEHIQSVKKLDKKIAQALDKAAPKAKDAKVTGGTIIKTDAKK